MTRKKKAREWWAHTSEAVGNLYPCDELGSKDSVECSMYALPRIRVREVLRPARRPRRKK